MREISKEEYFYYAIENKLLNKKAFYYAVLTIPLQNKNEYYEINNKKQYIVNMGKEKNLIVNASSENPLFNIKDKITLFNANMSNIKDKVDTDIGKAIFNYILLVFPFKNKIPYKNENNIDISDYCDEVANLLKKNVITVEELTLFYNACSLAQTLSRIIVISSTEKIIVPPPGLEKFKKELVEKFNKKYKGTSWMYKMVPCIEFQNELLEFDKQYIKDDPTYGKVLSGKAKDARTKMMLSFNQDSGLKEQGEENIMILNSLLESYPKDKEQLAALWNSNRSGSFARGAETQDGGTAAKESLRATSTIIIKESDCGSTRYKRYFVTKDLLKVLVGRYYLKNNKLEVITENDTDLIGKVIKVRSPMYCNEPDKVFCIVCCGEMMRNRKNGVVGMVTGISGALLKASLKKMHNLVKKLVKVDTRDYIS